MDDQINIPPDASPVNRSLVPKTDNQIIMERTSREAARQDRQYAALHQRVIRLEQALGIEPPMGDY